MNSNFESFGGESVKDAEAVENVENKERKKGILDKFFKKHLSFLVLSAVLSYAQDRTVNAEELQEPQSVTLNSPERVSVENERKANFQKLEEIIESGDIEAKVSKLKEIFGPAVESFLSIRRISSDLDLLKDLEESKNEDGAFVHKNGPGMMTPGSIVSDLYKTRWENRETISQGFSFKNIDKVPGFSEQQLNDFLKSKYPGNYISSSVSEIEFTDQTQVVGSSEILGQAQVFGLESLARSTSGDNRMSVKVNLPTAGIDRETFLDILEHEVGHTVDWNNNPSLTSAERVSMLSDVLSRVQSEDRFRSEYVEGISVEKLEQYFSGKIDDPKEREQYVNYIKTNEYWAEVSKAYFENQDKFMAENPLDHEMVKKWVTAISQ